jgi:hypothetical protein
MSEIPPLNVKIYFDASGVQPGVAKATAGLEQISNQSKRLSSTMSSLKTTILGVFGGTLLTQGVMMVGHELNAMKQETINLQSSTLRLNQALSGIGITSEKTQKEIYNNADAYYQLGFQGSEAVTAMGTLVTATNDVEKSTKLLAMAADLARYKHIGLESAARILARGTQGAARAFKEMGITLDASLPKNEAIAKAFDELNKKIGGQAQAYAKSFTGQLAILKEKFDNIAQAIGSVVIPILTRFVAYLGTVFSWISQNSAALKVFVGIILTVTAALKGLAIIQAIIAGINPFTYMVLGAMALAAAFVYLWNRFKIFRDTMAEGLATIISIVGYLVGAVGKLIQGMSYLPGMKFLKGVADGFDKVAISIGKAAKATDDLKNKSITSPKIPSILGGVKPGEKTGIVGAVPNGNATKGGSSGSSGSSTVQNITVYASNTNDIARQMAKAQKQGTPIGAK